MTTLKVGIANYEQMKARTLAVARGKQRARGEDPKICFTSMESFAKVLSHRNRALLALIAETQPGSLAELSELSGRAKSNLSRTLKTRRGMGWSSFAKGRAGRWFHASRTQASPLAVPLGSGRRAGGCRGRAAVCEPRLQRLIFRVTPCPPEDGLRFLRKRSKNPLPEKSQVVGLGTGRAAGTSRTLMVEPTPAPAPTTTVFLKSNSNVELNENG